METNARTRLIRLPQLIELVGMQKTAIYARIKAGTFPPPAKNGRASVWSESEVNDWIRKQLLRRVLP